MLGSKLLFKEILRTEIVAYWAHGFCGSFFLMVLIDENFMLFYVFFFPVAIGLTILAIIWGFTSIPTAILSLLLIGVVVEDFKNPMLTAYVIWCLVIVGYRIYRFIIDQHAKAH